MDYPSPQRSSLDGPQQSCTMTQPAFNNPEKAEYINIVHICFNIRETDTIEHLKCSSIQLHSQHSSKSKTQAPTNKNTQISSSTPYPRPHDSSLSPTTTALLIIDMQSDFLSPSGYLASQGHSVERFTPVIPRLQSLLAVFRNAKSAIYYTREGHADMSTVSTRELHRSSVNGAKIGSKGPLGRLLIRGEEGHEIIEELRPVEGEMVIDKPGRGAFTHTELDLSLRAKGVRNLLVCGVTADACVSSTVREASDRAYDVCVLEDGVESVTEELKAWAL